MNEQKKAWKRDHKVYMVIDHERKEFNIIENFGNATAYDQKVSLLIDAGRNLKGFPSEKEAKVAKKEYEDTFGYAYVEYSLLNLNE